MRRLIILLLFLCTLGLLIGCRAPTNTAVPPPAPIPPDTDLPASPPITQAERLWQTEATAVPETTSPPPVPETTASVSTPEAPPQTVKIPKLRGLLLAEAEAILSDAGLSYTVETQYSGKAPAGTVLSFVFYGTVEADHYDIKPDRPMTLTISLGFRPIVNLVAPDKNRVYLTFDDGPCKGTDEILEILAEYDVKATFFTLGMYAAVYPERTKAIADGGHCLACHSYSHNYETLYQSPDAVLDEIASWKRAVKKALGTEPQDVIFRFPGGSTTYYMDNDRFYDIFWTLTDAGVRVFDWSFANNDRYPGGKREEQSMEDYLKEATVSSLANCETAPAWPKIMLLHETAEETIALLPWIIEYLTEQGYTFGTLDELDGYWLMAGR